MNNKDQEFLVQKIRSQYTEKERERRFSMPVLENGFCQADCRAVWFLPE